MNEFYGDEVNEVNLSELEDYSPEGIAKVLFSNQPRPAFSYQIIAEQSQTDIPYIFEILTIILLEGLETLTGDLSQANMDNFTKEHLTILNPWFKSLGFNINVDVCNDNDKEAYDGYYCRILINDILNKVLFKMRNIEKNYHFFLNGNNLAKNEKATDLMDLYSILSVNGKTYCISFNFHIPETVCSKPDHINTGFSYDQF